MSTRTQFVVIRNGIGHGQIEAVVSVEDAQRMEEERRAREEAQDDVVAVAGSMDFGPPLPEARTDSVQDATAPAQPLTRTLLIVGGACLVALVLIVLTTLGRSTAAPPAVRIPPTATPLVLPTPLPYAVYWAPNGERAGALQRTQELSSTARFGEDWLQVQVEGGGKLWLNMHDSHLDRTPTFLSLPDLKPRPTPTAAPIPTSEPVQAVPAPVAPAQICTDNYPLTINGKVVATTRICGATQEEFNANGAAWGQQVAAEYEANRRATAEATMVATPAPTPAGKRPGHVE